MYRTLAQRKSIEAERRVAAVRDLSEKLEAFARCRGGRYILYGSTAREGMRHDSDIDLLIDFPSDLQAEAWRVAERVCTENGLDFDLMPLAWCEPGFVAKILPTARTLG